MKMNLILSHSAKTEDEEREDYEGRAGDGVVVRLHRGLTIIIAAVVLLF